MQQSNEEVTCQTAQSDWASTVQDLMIHHHICHCDVVVLCYVLCTKQSEAPCIPLQLLEGQEIHVEILSLFSDLDPFSKLLAK